MYGATHSAVLVDQLSAYFNDFGSKLCAFEDMKLAMNGFISADSGDVTEKARAKLVSKFCVSANG